MLSREQNLYIECINNMFNFYLPGLAYQENSAKVQMGKISWVRKIFGDQSSAYFLNLKAGLSYRARQPHSGQNAYSLGFVRITAIAKLKADTYLKCHSVCTKSHLIEIIGYSVHSTTLMWIYTPSSPIHK